MGFRSWLLDKLSGGEPSWIVLAEVSPGRARQLAEQLSHEGIETRFTNGTPSSLRRVMGPRPEPVTWVSVLEPDLERARELVGDDLADERPADPTAAKFVDDARSYVTRHRGRTNGE